MQQSTQAGFWKKNQRALAPWFFMAPGIIMFLVYVIYPIFQSIGISFYEWDGLGPKTYVGLQNYRDLLDDDSFYTSLKNNVIWLVLYLLAIPAGLAVALFLNQTVAGSRLDFHLVLCSGLWNSAPRPKFLHRNSHGNSGR
jgi:multiple sugar transport system permease protein